MALPRLRVCDAYKRYGSVKALDGVDLEVFGGELLGLLGPNGAGKTTLIRAICGRHRLQSGGVFLEGRLLRPGSDRSSLGFVPQELAIYGDLTARQNLEVFGRLHGLMGALLARRVEEALRWTQLAGRASELVSRFSGGMRRRLNIACGVLHRPPVILLDEPTVGVDPQSRECIYGMLLDLKNSGAAILLTTHQLEEAEHRCDRIQIMDLGRTVAVGTVEELIEGAVGRIQHLTAEVERRGDDSGEVRGVEAVGVELRDLDRELPLFLEQVKQRGCVVRQMTIRPPSLQDVFLRLTGRELRE